MGNQSRLSSLVSAQGRQFIPNVKMKGLQRAAGTVRKTVEKVVVHPPYFYQYLPAGEASAAPPLGPLLGRVQ